MDWPPYWSQRDEISIGRQSHAQLVPGAQVIPPSPPVFVYEVITMSSAFAGSGLFLLVGCLCCTVFGAKSPRGRHTSRFWGTKLLRVDRMPYAKREHELRGEDWHDGPFKGDLPMRAREVPSAASLGPLAAALEEHDLEHAPRDRNNRNNRNTAAVASLTFDTLMGNRRPARQWTPVASR